MDDLIPSFSLPRGSPELNPSFQACLLRGQWDAQSGNVAPSALASSPKRYRQLYGIPAHIHRKPHPYGVPSWKTVPPPPSSVAPSHPNQQEPSEPGP